MPYANKPILNLLTGTAILFLFNNFTCRKTIDEVYNEIAGQQWRLTTQAGPTIIRFSSNDSDVLDYSGNVEIGTYQIRRDNYPIQDEYNFDGYSVYVDFFISSINTTQYVLFKGSYTGQLKKLSPNGRMITGKLTVPQQNAPPFSSDFFAKYP